MSQENGTFSESEMNGSTLDLSRSNSDPATLISHYKEKLDGSMKVIRMFNKELNHVKKKSEENEIENTRLKLRIQHLERKLAEQITEFSQTDDMNITENMSIPSTSSSEMLGNAAMSIGEVDGLYSNSRNDTSICKNMSIPSTSSSEKLKNTNFFEEKDDGLYQDGWNSKNKDKKDCIPTITLSSDSEDANDQCSYSNKFQNNPSTSTPFKQLKAKKCFTKKRNVHSEHSFLNQQNSKELIAATGEQLKESNFHEIKSEPDLDCNFNAVEKSPHYAISSTPKFTYSSAPIAVKTEKDIIFDELLVNHTPLKDLENGNLNCSPSLSRNYSPKSPSMSGYSTEAIIDESENNKLDSSKKSKKKRRFKKERISSTVSSSQQKQISSQCSLVIENSNEVNFIKREILNTQQSFTASDISTEAAASESEQIENLKDISKKPRKKRKIFKRSRSSYKTPIVKEQINSVENQLKIECGESENGSGSEARATLSNQRKYPKSSTRKKHGSPILGPSKKKVKTHSETSDSSKFSVHKTTFQNDSMEEICPGDLSTEVFANQDLGTESNSGVTPIRKLRSLGKGRNVLKNSDTRSNMVIVPKRKLRSHGKDDGNAGQNLNTINNSNIVAKRNLKSHRKKEMNVKQDSETDSDKNIVPEKKLRSNKKRDTPLNSSDCRASKSKKNPCYSEEINLPVTRSLRKKRQTDECGSSCTKVDRIPKEIVQKKLHHHKVSPEKDKLIKECSRNFKRKHFLKDTVTKKGIASLEQIEMKHSFNHKNQRNTHTISTEEINDTQQITDHQKEQVHQNSLENTFGKLNISREDIDLVEDLVNELMNKCSDKLKIEKRLKEIPVKTNVVPCERIEIPPPLYYENSLNNYNISTKETNTSLKNVVEQVNATTKENKLVENLITRALENIVPDVSENKNLKDETLFNYNKNANQKLVLNENQPSKGNAAAELDEHVILQHIQVSNPCREDQNSENFSFEQGLSTKKSFMHTLNLEPLAEKSVISVKELKRHDAGNSVNVNIRETSEKQSQKLKEYDNLELIDSSPVHRNEVSNKSRNDVDEANIEEAMCSGKNMDLELINSSPVHGTELCDKSKNDVDEANVVKCFASLSKTTLKLTTANRESVNVNSSSIIPSAGGVSNYKEKIEFPVSNPFAENQELECPDSSPLVEIQETEVPVSNPFAEIQETGVPVAGPLADNQETEVPVSSSLVEIQETEVFVSSPLAEIKETEILGSSSLAKNQETEIPISSPLSEIQETEHDTEEEQQITKASKYSVIKENYEKSLDSDSDTPEFTAGNLSNSPYDDSDCDPDWGLGYRLKSKSCENKDNITLRRKKIHNTAIKSEDLNSKPKKLAVKFNFSNRRKPRGKSGLKESPLENHIDSAIKQYIKEKKKTMKKWRKLFWGTDSDSDSSLELTSIKGNNKKLKEDTECIKKDMSTVVAGVCETKHKMNQETFSEKENEIGSDDSDFDFDVELIDDITREPLVLPENLVKQNHKTMLSVEDRIFEYDLNLNNKEKKLPKERKNNYDNNSICPDKTMLNNDDTINNDSNSDFDLELIDEINCDMLQLPEHLIVNDLQKNLPVEDRNRAFSGDEKSVKDPKNLSMEEDGSNLIIGEDSPNQTIGEGSPNLTIEEDGPNLTIKDGLNLTIEEDGPYLTIEEDGQNVTIEEVGPSTAIEENDLNIIIEADSPNITIEDPVFHDITINEKNKINSGVGSELSATEQNCGELSLPKNFNENNEQKIISIGEEVIESQCSFKNIMSLELTSNISNFKKLHMSETNHNEYLPLENKVSGETTDIEECTTYTNEENTSTFNDKIVHEINKSHSIDSNSIIDSKLVVRDPNCGELQLSENLYQKNINKLSIFSEEKEMLTSQQDNAVSETDLILLETQPLCNNTESIRNISSDTCENVSIAPENEEFNVEASSKDENSYSAIDKFDNKELKQNVLECDLDHSLPLNAETTISEKGNKLKEKYLIFQAELKMMEDQQPSNCIQNMKGTDLENNTSDAHEIEVSAFNDIAVKNKEKYPAMVNLSCVPDLCTESATANSNENLDTGVPANCDSSQIQISNEECSQVEVLDHNLCYLDRFTEKSLLTNSENDIIPNASAKLSSTKSTSLTKGSNIYQLLKIDQNKSPTKLPFSIPQTNSIPVEILNNLEIKTHDSIEASKSPCQMSVGQMSCVATVEKKSMTASENSLHESNPSIPFTGESGFGARRNEKKCSRHLSKTANAKRKTSNNYLKHKNVKINPENPLKSILQSIDVKGNYHDTLRPHTSQFFAAVCFGNCVKSLVNYFMYSGKISNMAHVIYFVIKYLHHTRENPLENFSENQEAILIPATENCIVTALFDIEKKSDGTFQGLLTTAVNEMHQFVLAKNKMHIYGLASICRVLTEICKRKDNKLKPLHLCCDLLREKHKFASILIVSVAKVWEEVFWISDNLSEKENALQISIAYGITKSVARSAVVAMYCSLKVISEYFDVSRNESDMKRVIEVLKEVIGEGSSQSLPENSWMLTSPLVIFAASETWEPAKKTLIEDYILPNLQWFSHHEINKEAFDLLCNLYVDILLLFLEEHPDELLKYFHTSPQCKGGSFVQDCAAIALIKYYILSKKDVPVFLKAWQEENQTKHEVKALKVLYKRRLMSDNATTFTKDEIMPN